MVIGIMRTTLRNQGITRNVSENQKVIKMKGEQIMRNKRSQKIRLVAIVLLFCLMGTIFSAEKVKAAPSGEGIYKVTASSGVNVRSGAGTNSSKITALKNGTEFTVTQVSGDWGYVPKYGGWINLQYASLQSRASVNNTQASSELPDGYYFIRSKLDTSKVVDVSGASKENGATLILQGCHYGNNQIFEFKRQADGSYMIISKHSGLAVEVRDSSHDNGGDVAQWEYVDGYACKLWYVIYDGGYYKLVNKESGLCMDVFGNRTEDGTNIQQHQDHGGDNQRFQLDPVSGNIIQPSDTQSYTVHANGGLRIRQGRGTQYASIATIPNGTSVEIRNISSNWGEVTYNGKTGYISMNYVTLNTKNIVGKSVSLNVPDMKQTDTRWRYETIGNSGKTIGAIGCAITSLAMAESYRTHTTINPSQMKSNLSFTSSGALYWPSNYVKYSGSNYLTKIKELLNAGKPVLVCGFTPSGGQHWIVVTGYRNGGNSASDFTINDPSSTARVNLQLFFNKYSTYSCIRYYN